MGKKKQSKIFPKKVDKMIINLRNKGKPYSMIRNEINRKIGKKNDYNSKQIRQRWTNNLDTNCCHGDLGQDEKDFIIQWVAKHKEIEPNGTIRWKNLIREMMSELRKSQPRTENKVKNFYYTCEKKSKAGHSMSTTSSSPPSSMGNSAATAIPSQPPQPPILAANTASNFAVLSSPLPISTEGTTIQNSPPSISTEVTTSNSTVTFDPYKSSLKLPHPIPTVLEPKPFQTISTEATQYSPPPILTEGTTSNLDPYKSSLKLPNPIPAVLEPKPFFSSNVIL